MQVFRLFAAVALLAGIVWADPIPPCPATVTSCTFTLSPGESGNYQVTFYQNSTPFWEVDPVSGWSPTFKSILTPTELATGQLPYNVEYDFIVGIGLANNPGSGQVTVDFQLPASLTNWVVVGYPDYDGGNGANVYTSSGGSTGAGQFYTGPGGAYILTAVPGQIVVSMDYTDYNFGDTIFSGMLIGEVVPEPATWSLAGIALLSLLLMKKRKARV